jgi:pre-mRNA-splicing factor SYF1
MCRACRAVEEAEKPYMYNIYIARATEFFGVTRTREIYEQAISTLPEKFIVRQLPLSSPSCGLTL